MKILLYILSVSSASFPLPDNIQSGTQADGNKNALAENHFFKISHREVSVWSKITATASPFICVYTIIT